MGWIILGLIVVAIVVLVAKKCSCTARPGAKKPEEEKSDEGKA